jgi:hypothetical protein
MSESDTGREDTEQQGAGQAGTSDTGGDLDLQGGDKSGLAGGDVVSEKGHAEGAFGEEHSGDSGFGASGGDTSLVDDADTGGAGDTGSEGSYGGPGGESQDAGGESQDAGGY